MHGDTFVAFKSYHFGIETGLLVYNGFADNSTLNRTILELKRKRDHFEPARNGALNRTILELKHQVIDSGSSPIKL